jgi:hypothetical protein
LRKLKSPTCPSQERRDKDGTLTILNTLYFVRAPQAPFNRFISNSKILAGALIGVKEAVWRGVSSTLPTDRPEFRLAGNLVRFP